MNKNIILSIALVCSIAITLMVLWPTNRPLVRQTKNYLQSIVYRGTIKTMFEDNMKFIKEVLAICEKNGNKNITDQELESAGNDITMLAGTYSLFFDKIIMNTKYGHLLEQRLPLDNPFGPDWAGTPIDQWMQLVYTLRTKHAENPQAKIYPLAEQIILNNMPIETKSLHEHIAAMRFLDAQKQKK